MCSIGPTRVLTMVPRNNTLPHGVVGKISGFLWKSDVAIGSSILLPSALIKFIRRK